MRSSASRERGNVGNQFDAKIRFDAIAWRAYDKETGAYATIIDHMTDAEWSVSKGAFKERGRTKTPQGARAAARRCIARLAKGITS